MSSTSHDSGSVPSSVAETKAGEHQQGNRLRRRLLLGGLGLAAAGATATGIRLSQTPVHVFNGKSRARTVVGDDVLPHSVDVVVIGGGFVGTATALNLAERGVSVALCEKGVIAGEASGRSFGFVDSQMQAPEKFELIAHSKTLWSRINERIGIDTGYRAAGLLQGLRDAENQAWAEASIAATKGMPGANDRVLSHKEIAQLFPELIDAPPAALYSPDGASVEPRLAAPAIAEAARRKGAVLLQECAVRGVEMQAGRISGVVTEKGSIACRSVVLAGGAWSAVFMKSLGLPRTQIDFSMSMANIATTNGPKSNLGYFEQRFGLRRQVDSSYSISGFEIDIPLRPSTLANLSSVMPSLQALWPVMRLGLSPANFLSELTEPSRWPLDAPSPFEARRILVPAHNPRPVDEALRGLREHLPIFGTMQVRERWAGVLSTTPDNMPILSAVSAYPGLFIGSGFVTGLTTGLAAGEVLADLSTGNKPSIDLHLYRLERFTDGSPLGFYM